MLTLNVAGTIIKDGKAIAHFHADQSRDGAYVAYRPGARDKAITWHNTEQGCGPTFATAEQVIDFLEANGQ